MAQSIHHGERKRFTVTWKLLHLSISEHQRQHKVFASVVQNKNCSSAKHRSNDERRGIRLLHSWRCCCCCALKNWCGWSSCKCCHAWCACPRRLRELGCLCLCFTRKRLLKRFCRRVADFCLRHTHSFHPEHAPLCSKLTNICFAIAFKAPGFCSQVMY